MEQKIENQYDKYLNKLWKSFANKFKFNTESEFSAFFKEKIIESLNDSFTLHRYSDLSNKHYWHYISFRDSIATILMEEIENYHHYDNISSKKIKNFFDKEKYANLIFYHIYNDILSNMLEKIHLEFSIQQDEEVPDLFNVMANKILNTEMGSTQICLDDNNEIRYVPLKDNNGLALNAFDNDEILKNLIYFLNEAQKFDEQNFKETNQKWDIEEANYENPLHELRYSGDEYYDIYDSNSYDEYFFVSNSTYSAKLMYEPGANKDFDGKISDMNIDIDEYLQKYDINENKLLEILNNQSDIMLSDLWNKSFSDNIFDATDKFLRNNDLDTKFAVMSYKGKSFEIIPIYQETECISSDYLTNYRENIVKYEFCQDAKLKEKIIDFLAQQKQNLYDNIKESFEEVLKENYNSKVRRM